MFAVRQQHPAGEEAFRIGDPAGRHVVRKIREPRVDAHLAVIAEGRWKQRDAALEGPVVAYPRRAGVPPIAVLILKCVAVPGAGNETTGLVSHGVIGRVFEWAQRVVRDIGAGGVNVVLGAGRSVLQVIAAVMLGQPCAFHVRRLALARVIRPESFPAVLLRFERDQGAGLADVMNALLGIGLPHIHFDAVQRKLVRRSPVEIPAAVVILEKRGIPWPRLNMRGLRVSLVPAAQTTLRFSGHRAGQFRHAAGQEIQLRRAPDHAIPASARDA